MRVSSIEYRVHSAMNSFNCFCCEPDTGNEEIATVIADDYTKYMQDFSEFPDDVKSKAMPRPLESGSNSRSEPAVVRCKVTKRPGMKLGLHVDYGDGVNLRVTKVKPGLIAEWNEQHPDQKVEMGALISNINGSSGSASDLLELTQSVDTLDMTVLIP
mmetsp:Transcript_95512/g.151107  ORF Transcript_95512/g.151107 Transcript_95512/m.151107 type:complete len:158 (+) Transcript_95512:55-528(+)